MCLRACREVEPTVLLWVGCHSEPSEVRNGPTKKSEELLSALSPAYRRLQSDTVENRCSAVQLCTGIGPGTRRDTYRRVDLEFIAHYQCSVRRLYGINDKILALYIDYREDLQTLRDVNYVYRYNDGNFRFVQEHKRNKTAASVSEQTCLYLHTQQPSADVKNGKKTTARHRNLCAPARSEY